MEYKEHEQPPQAVPPSLLPSVLRRLGLGDAPTTRVEEQIAALRDEERRRGGTADRSTGEHAQAARWEFVVAALRDPAWEVRAAAVWTLGTWGEQAPGEALLNALSDEDGSVRAAALRTLCRMSGRGALEAALRLLHDAEWQVREAAALTVGELVEQAQASSELLMVSITDENAIMRETARTAFEQLYPATLCVPLLAFEEASDESPGNHVPTVSEHPHSNYAMETSPIDQTKLNGTLDQTKQQKEFPDGMVSLCSGKRRDASLRKGQRTRAIPPRARLLNLFNGLAAVLVVGLIIAGALALFTHRSPNVGSSAPTASAALPFQPLPSDCFFLPQQLSNRYCPHDPFTQLHGSRDTAGYTIALKQAYADANQVLIEYTVTNDANHRPTSTADIVNYSTLRTQNGITLRGGGSTGFPSVGIMNFDFEPATSMPPASTRTLSLHLLIHGMNAPVVSPKPFRPVTFDFSLPFHSSRAVIMQQTVTIAGKSVTLTQAVATPSETRFYLYSRDIPLHQGNSFSLTENGRNVNENGSSVGGITNQDGYLTLHPDQPITTEIVDFEPLFDSHAVGVLTVSAPSGSHAGPWVFHFTIH